VLQKSIASLYVWPNHPLDRLYQIDSRKKVGGGVGPFDGGEVGFFDGCEVIGLGVERFDGSEVGFFDGGEVVGFGDGLFDGGEVVGSSMASPAVALVAASGT